MSIANGNQCDCKCDCLQHDQHFGTISAGRDFVIMTATAAANATAFATAISITTGYFTFSSSATASNSSQSKPGTKLATKASFLTCARPLS